MLSSNHLMNKCIFTCVKFYQKNYNNIYQRAYVCFVEQRNVKRTKCFYLKMDRCCMRCSAYLMNFKQIFEWRKAFKFFILSYLCSKNISIWLPVAVAYGYCIWFNLNIQISLYISCAALIIFITFFFCCGD